MKKICLMLATILLSACDGAPIYRGEFMVDDCVVKKVTLGTMGNTVYIASCGKDVTTTWKKQVGKTSTTVFLINKENTN